MNCTPPISGNPLRSLLSALCLFTATLALGTEGAAEKVTLSNGDVLNGEVVERSASGVVLVHPQLGRIEVPQTALAPDAPPDPGAFGSGLLVGWKRQLGFGLVGEEGNTDSQDLSADLRMSFADDHKRWAIRGDYQREEDDNEKNENQSKLSVRRDWLTPGSRMFYLAAGRYERDSFEQWRQRYGVGAGVGYQFIDTDDWSIRGTAGLTFTRTSGNGSEHDVTPEALFGLEASWQMNEHNRFSLENSFYPSLDVLGDYRNLTEAAWTIDPGDTIPWEIEFSIANEYESDAENPVKNNDFDYAIKLLWDF